MRIRFSVFLHHAATVGGFALGLTLLWAFRTPRALWRTVLLVLFTVSQAFAFLKLIAYAAQNRDPLRERLERHPKPALAPVLALCGAAFKLGVPLLLA